MNNQNQLIAYILFTVFVVGLGYVLFTNNFFGIGVNVDVESNNRLSDEFVLDLLDENAVNVESHLSPIQLLTERQNRARLEKKCFSGKDCVPSIDEPKFVDIVEADLFLEDNDVVIGLESGGAVRAYPIKILNWHEVVNDTVNGDPVTVSFCPYSYSANAFIRSVDGEATEFGVSGYLLNSNLVMYDHKTGSFWSQMTGEAVVGPKTGSYLRKINVSLDSWINWKSLHPDTDILSLDTGYSRDYQQSPYAEYQSSEKIFFSVENSNDKLPLKEVVYGVVVNNVPKAYSRDLLESKVGNGVLFRDFVGGVAVEGQYRDGLFLMVNTVTREEIVPQVGFWFVWVAFYPNTGVWE